MAEFSDDTSNQKPKLNSLFLYFATPELRGVCYAGFATSLLYNSLSTQRKLSVLGIAGLMYFTSYLNLFNPHFQLFRRNCKGRPPEERSSWSTHASDSLGWMGAWWVGAGNGDWFAFVGHNGSDETTILPSIILDQMSVKKTPPSEGTVIIEELGETVEIQMDEVTQ